MLQRSIMVFVAVLLTVAATVLLTPKLVHGDHGQGPNLEQLVPTSFGEWRVDDSAATMVVSPQMQAVLEKIYSQTLTRTYINQRGQRIMLSLAYGADQSRALQVHKPEVCYEAQGFRVKNAQRADVPTSLGHLPVMRVLALRNNRSEPITYWIRSGDELIRGWFEQNRARLLTGLKGHIPDGLLVRVSSIDADPERAYQMQDAFVRDMLGSLSAPGRQMLLGSDLGSR